MGREAPKLSLVLVAVAFALSCFGFTLFVWKSFGGPTPFEAHGYRVHILFGSEASGLSPNADVRIAGVSIGKVISVNRRGLGADALIDVDAKFAPLPSDTRAIIRFKSLLGETFVSLSPGSREAPRLKEGATLARSNVDDVQQVDTVLASFDKKTQDALATFLQDTARALKGRGPDLNNAIGHFAPTTESVADLINILDRQRTSLRQVISQGGVVLRTIGDRSADLRSMIDAGNQVFSATAARNREVTQTIQAFPEFLRTTREALTVIDGAARDIEPTLRAFRPVIPLIRPALNATNDLAPELNRTFLAAEPFLRASQTGFPALNRILNAAQPSLKVLYVAGRELIPIAKYLSLVRNDVVSATAKTGSSTQYVLPDGSQHALRNTIPVNEEALVTASQRLPSNRFNPYPAPSATDLVGAPGGLKSWSCDHLGNPQAVPVVGTAPAGCSVQGAYAFRGKSQFFPRVTLDKP